MKTQFLAVPLYLTFSMTLVLSIDSSTTPREILKSLRARISHRASRQSAPRLLIPRQDNNEQPPISFYRPYMRPIKTYALVNKQHIEPGTSTGSITYFDCKDKPLGGHTNAESTNYNQARSDDNQGKLVQIKDENIKKDSIKTEGQPKEVTKVPPMEITTVKPDTITKEIPVIISDKARSDHQRSENNNATVPIEFPVFYGSGVKNNDKYTGQVKHLPSSNADSGVKEVTVIPTLATTKGSGDVARSAGAGDSKPVIDKQGMKLEEKIKGLEKIDMKIPTKKPYRSCISRFRTVILTPQKKGGKPVVVTLSQREGGGCEGDKTELRVRVVGVEPGNYGLYHGQDCGMESPEGLTQIADVEYKKRYEDSTVPSVFTNLRDELAGRTVSLWDNTSSKLLACSDAPSKSEARSKNNDASTKKDALIKT